MSTRRKQHASDSAPDQQAPPRVEQVSIDDLVPYDRNSRIHSATQVEQLQASIREFGFTSPLLIDDMNHILAGHGRLIAARKVGLPSVPCIRLSHLSHAQKQAYVIADNKLAELSSWDEELLAREFQALQTSEADLESTGFDKQEVDRILNIPERLADKSETLAVIMWTRILISIPKGVSIAGIDAVLAQVKAHGGEVDFGGN